MKKIYFTYIVLCSDDSLYCGYTNNLFNRIKTHNSGLGGKYTRAKLPVKLLYYESFSSKSEAMSREYKIKKIKKIDKLELIKNINFTIIE